MAEGYHDKMIAKAYYDPAAKVFPLKKNVLAALQLVPFECVKVVILGQDPYFNERPLGTEAHGLSFSVREGIPIPPSLRNIFKEINTSLYNGEKVSKVSDLTRWAEQGVLLLNSSLTVLAGQPNSHSRIGWQVLTDNIIETLSAQQEGIVFMLWGAYAQKKTSLISAEKHCLLSTSHPSPLSAHRGFSGSDVFVKCNGYLAQNNTKPIIW